MSEERPEQVQETPQEPEASPAPVEQPTEAGGTSLPDREPPPTETASTPAAKPPPQDWRDRRIAQLTARLKTEQEKNAARLPEPSSPAALTVDPNQVVATRTELDRLVQEKAVELSAVQEFNRLCNQTAEAGRQKFGASEFDQKVQQLQRLVDANDPQQAQAYHHFLTAAIETEKGPEILTHLGSDLDEAARIMALAPVKMAVALAKIAQKLPSDDPTGDQGPSGAPRPIRPVGARSAQHTPISPDDPDRADQLSTAEWMRRREEQDRQRRAEGRRF